MDWQSRELATVGALAALPGVAPQLQAHMRISMNVGLSPAQLSEAANVLTQNGHPEAGQRARSALDQLATSRPSV
ncbi:MAG TPA: carboxymuconolactone decarboxylase family protein [Ramlibacter sp.]|nr:carboxymuconolactone decarboxylase family protein [Ramlibacter sp.]